MGRYVEVVTELALDGTLTYSVPEGDAVEVGARVLVTVAGKRHYGVVVQCHNMKPSFRTRPVSQIIDRGEPLFSKEDTELWIWISKYYMCAPGSVFKAAAPAAIRTNSFNHSTDLIVKLSPETDVVSTLDSLKRAPAQSKALVSFLEISEATDQVFRSELLKKCTAEALNQLCKKGILEIIQIHKSLSPFAPKGIKLASSDEVLHNKIKAKFAEKSTVLLWEKAFSDKFELLAAMVEDTVAAGMQVLIITPDSYTAETMYDRMSACFKAGVVQYHPKQTEHKRAESLIRSRSEAAVVIGSRSAVFLPMQSLGLIIIDQEHDQNYKNSDSSPRIHARDVALVKASKVGAKVLLCSECPTVESYYNATRGAWGLVETECKNLLKPSFMVLERGKELLSKYLRNKIQETIDAGKQAMVFQNRRGFSQWVECPTCQHQPMCRRCNVSLTYHKADNSLRCHYCGYFEPFTGVCSECGSKEMTFQGRGTERIEESLQTIFPDAKIERIDYDSTRQKDAFEQIAASIATDCNIVVGTQMVVRGVDFSNIGLVGIANADNLLSHSDFRSSERAYSLLTMISNRVGEGGEVVIQTTKHLDTVIKSVKESNHSNFYETEIAHRKMLHYPPAVRMIKFTFADKIRERLFASTSHFERLLRPTFGNRLSPPFEPDINKKEDFYLMEFYLRIEREKSVIKAKEIVQTAIASIKQGFSSVLITADVDPV